MKKSRMFHLNRDKPIKTWNPCVGCKHNCYHGRCWASLMAKRLKNNWRYKDGFDHPKLVEAELKRRFRGGVVVFVSSMADMFGKWVPSEWIHKVIETMKQSSYHPPTSEVVFFLETKNPKRYQEFLGDLPKNVILSATIETNRDYKVSSAPTTAERYEAMKNLDWDKKHISIEPIMDFDLEVLVGWVREINPILVSVGYDNYKAGLVEPPLEKTLKLIDELEKFTKVERKSLREANERKI